MRRAFSLVEVVLALGITSFALIALVSLLPAGLRLVGESDDESRAVNLVAELIADRSASSYTNASRRFAIPKLENSPATGEFGVGEEGLYVGSDFSKARYRVSYDLIPPQGSRLDPWICHFRVGWPAGDSTFKKSVEATGSFPTP